MCHIFLYLCSKWDSIESIESASGGKPRIDQGKLEKTPTSLQSQSAGTEDI